MEPSAATLMARGPSSVQRRIRGIDSAGVEVVPEEDGVGDTKDLHAIAGGGDGSADDFGGEVRGRLGESLGCDAGDGVDDLHGADDGIKEDELAAGDDEGTSIDAEGDAEGGIGEGEGAAGVGLEVDDGESVAGSPRVGEVAVVADDEMGCAGREGERTGLRGDVERGIDAAGGKGDDIDAIGGEVGDVESAAAFIESQVGGMASDSDYPAETLAPGGATDRQKDQHSPPT